MKTMSLFAALVLMGGLGMSAALAQRGPGGGMPPGAGYGRIYNPQTVETITGEVVKVEKASPMRGGMGQGVHLLVRTNANTEPISVHLGPSWFMENQEVQIQPKDQVQVTGSRVELAGKPALIAAEVTKGNQELKLRDENGLPVWAAWRQSGMGGAGMGPQGMGRGMMSKEMAERRQQMMAERQKLMAEMKAMDAELDQKVAQMNEAKGEAKVDAVADVINQLVKERKTMHQEMAKMREHMMPYMQGMQGTNQPGAGMGGTGSSSQTERGKE